MRRPLCMACLVFVLMLAGLLSFWRPPAFSLGELQNRTVTVTGVVDKKEEKENGTVIHIKQAAYLNLETEMKVLPPEGVLCYLESGQTPKLGSRIQIRGRLEAFEEATNFGEFDRRRFYQIQGLDCLMKKGRILEEGASYRRLAESLYRLRRYLEQALDYLFLPKDASVLKAMLLGTPQSSEFDSKDLYRRNGIAHIIAISGLHISIIGMGLYKLLRRIRVPLQASAVGSVVFMYAYGVMIGMSTSAHRAIFMFALSLLAVVTGRSYDMITAMAVAAVCILTGQPLNVFHTGFQLSFSAILAIGLTAPAFSFHIPTKNAITASFGISTAITITSMPILLYSYYELPLYSVFLNLLVIPLMTVLLLCGMTSMSVFAAAANTWLGVNLSFLCTIPCTGILRIYELLCLGVEYLPFHTWLTGKPGIAQIIFYYLGLLALIVFYEKLPAFCMLLCLVFMSAVLTAHPGNSGLRITMLDVGQGDCFVVETQNGHTYLIDAGSSSKGKTGQYQLIPFLKASKIQCLDYVFITHSDSDHINGIQELLELSGNKNGIAVKRMVLPKIAASVQDDAYRNLEEQANKAGTFVSYMQKGDVLTDKELSITCLHPGAGFVPESANAYSLVLSLSYGEFDALFTGDVEKGGEAALCAELKRQKEEDSLKDYELLKAAHHGSKYSTGRELLELCRFEAALISCGRNNSYGHPHAEMLERLEHMGITWAVSAKTGSVRIETDGNKKMEIEKWR